MDVYFLEFGDPEEARSCFRKITFSCPSCLEFLSQMPVLSWLWSTEVNIAFHATGGHNFPRGTTGPGVWTNFNNKTFSDCTQFGCAAVQPTCRYFPPSLQKIISKQRFSPASLCHINPQFHPHIRLIFYHRGLLLSNHLTFRECDCSITC